MKIAIPTNDGLTLSSTFGQARGFLILSVELGEIIQEEMRWNKLSDILCSPDGLLDPIKDCEVIMTKNVGPSMTKHIAAQNKEIILTGETFITNAYVHFLENRYRQEANTCCCP